MIILNFVLVDTILISQYLEKHLKKKLVQFKFKKEIRDKNRGHNPSYVSIRDGDYRRKWSLKMAASVICLRGRTGQGML